MTPEEKNELNAQIAKWQKVTREKDGDSEYERVQFGLALSYAMLNNYKKFEFYINRLYDANDNNFMHYVFFESSKILNKKNVHIFELFVQLFFAQNLVTQLLGINFKNKYERKLAHYTTPSVANMILENDSRLRLNNIYNMNDPTEGDVLLQYIDNKLCLNGEYRDVHYTPFVACFTLNHDSLNQFRLYGKSNHKEATGVSLVVGDGFFNKDSDTISFIPVPKRPTLMQIPAQHQRERLSIGNTTNTESFTNSPEWQLLIKKFKDNLNQNIAKQAVYRCIYIDPETGYIRLAQRDKMTFYREFHPKRSVDEIEILWLEYQEYIQEKENKIKRILIEMRGIVEEILKNTNDEYNKGALELIGLILLPLQYLVKHSAFQEEQECRMCHITSLKNKDVKVDFDKKWLYIEYPEPVERHIANVYIATGAKEYYPFIVRLLGENGASKVQLSKNPFRT